MALCSTYCKWVLVMLEKGVSSIPATHNKWQNGKRNFCVGDVVLLCQNEVGQNQWPMAKVTEVFKDSSGYVQSIKLKVGKTNTSDQSNTMLERPVTKIVLFCESE